MDFSIVFIASVTTCFCLSAVFVTYYSMPLAVNLPLWSNVFSEFKYFSACVVSYFLKRAGSDARILLSF